jgi:hypothetical protein
MVTSTLLVIFFAPLFYVLIARSPRMVDGGNKPVEAVVIEEGAHE